MVSPGDTVPCFSQSRHCMSYHQMRQKQAVIYRWYHRQYVLLAGPQVRFHSACWYFSVDERLGLWANRMWNINSGPDKVPQIIQAFLVLFISSFLSAPTNWCPIPLKGYPALSHFFTLSWVLICKKTAFWGCFLGFCNFWLSFYWFS